MAANPVTASAPTSNMVAEYNLAQYIQQHKAEHTELEKMLGKMMQKIEENEKAFNDYRKKVFEALAYQKKNLTTLDRQNQKEHMGLIERIDKLESLHVATHAVAAARTQPDAAQQLANPNISGAMAFKICCDTFGRCATTPMVFTSSTFADMTMEPTAPEMGLYDGALNLASDWGAATRNALLNTKKMLFEDNPEKTNEPQILEYTKKPELNDLLKNYDSKEMRGSQFFPAFELATRDERKQLLEEDGYDYGTLESGEYYKLSDSTGKNPTLFFEAFSEMPQSITFMPFKSKSNPSKSNPLNHFFRGYLEGVESFIFDPINNAPDNFYEIGNPLLRSMQELVIAEPNVFTAEDPSNLPVISGAPSPQGGTTFKPNRKTLTDRDWKYLSGL